MARVIAISLLRLQEGEESFRSAGRNLRIIADAAQLGTPADDHISYASKLATFEGELIYEELHKLVSLLEEIEALRLLRFRIAAEKFDELRLAIDRRFHRDRRALSMVLEDRRAKWNEGWWYNTLIGGTRSD